MIIWILETFEIENNRDRKFIETIYNEYFRIMYKEAYTIVHNDDIARDIVHDSIVKLIHKLSLVKSFQEYVLVSYIVQTVRNTAINYVRKRDNARKISFEGIDDDMADSIPDSSVGTLEAIIHTEQINSLKSVLNKLDEKHRSLLISKYFLQKSDAEIAYELGINPNSIRTYLVRARRAAKALFERERGE